MKAICQVSWKTISLKSALQPFIALWLILPSISLAQTLDDLIKKAETGQDVEISASEEALLTHELLFTMYAANLRPSSVDYVQLTRDLIESSTCWESNDPQAANGYFWRTVRDSNPDMRERYLDVILGMRSVVDLGKPGPVGVFACGKYRGRPIEFVARELAPVTEEFLTALNLRAKKHVPPSIKVLTSKVLPPLTYDFEEGKLVFLQEGNSNRWSSSADYDVAIQALQYRVPKPEQVAHLEREFTDRHNMRYMVQPVTNPSINTKEANRWAVSTVGSIGATIGNMNRIRTTISPIFQINSVALWLDRRLDLQGGYVTASMNDHFRIPPSEAEEIVRRSLKGMNARAIIKPGKIVFSQHGVDILATFERVELLGPVTQSIDTLSSYEQTRSDSLTMFALDAEMFPNLDEVSSRVAAENAKAEREAAAKRREQEDARRAREQKEADRQRQIEELQAQLNREWSTCDQGTSDLKLDCLQSTCPRIETIQGQLQQLGDRSNYVRNCRFEIAQLERTHARKSDRERQAEALEARLKNAQGAQSNYENQVMQKLQVEMAKANCLQGNQEACASLSKAELRAMCAQLGAASVSFQPCLNLDAE